MYKGNVLLITDDMPAGPIALLTKSAPFLVTGLERNIFTIPALSAFNFRYHVRSVLCTLITCVKKWHFVP